MSFIVLVRGGGDLASGVVLRLHRSGLPVIVAELPRPMAVRRRVSFAEAIFSGEITIEGATARSVASAADFALTMQVLAKGQIPVIVDPDGDSIGQFKPSVIVDARMLKRHLEQDRSRIPLLIGLGPGFVAGENCHAVIETHRGSSMGRVIWMGPAQTDTGIPEAVAKHEADRVLRAPAEGTIEAFAEIGDHLEPGQLIADIGRKPVTAPFKDILRGLIHAGMPVLKGVKIGDADARDDPRLCTHVSDKALAVGGGVLEAILSRSELRSQLWK